MKIDFESSFHEVLYTRVYRTSEEKTVQVWRRFTDDYPQYRKYESDWLKTRCRGETPLSMGVPWITYPAIDWLTSVVGHRDRVFEWGMGGSTIFLAQKCHKVVSVEHDPKWFESAKDVIKQRLNASLSAKFKRRLLGQKSPELYLHEPEQINLGLANSDAVLSGAKGYENRDFSGYVKAIEKFPSNYFDLVLVDGRARMDCLFKAANYVKPGGFIMLDNSDYARYVEDLTEFEANQAKGWTKHVFLGPGPSSSCIGWRTTAYQRPLLQKSTSVLFT
jgi:hypothetical protein